MPATLPVQDRVDEPDPPTIDVDVRVQDRLVELVAAAMVTVPANPFTGATMVVEVPAIPEFKVTLVGLAVTVKSWTWNTTFAVWLKVPLVPVTVAR